MNTTLIIVFVGLLIFTAHLFEGIFAQKKIPDVLLLIILGLIIGPILHIINPEDFGIVGPAFVTIALVIILFQGGTKLHLNTIIKTVQGATEITLVSFILTALAIASIIFFMFDMPIGHSILIGTILGGTSSAIVIPLAKQLNLQENTITILTIESALSDVLAIVLSLSIIQTILENQLNIGSFIEKISSSLLVAALIGFASGIFWSILLEKVRHLQSTVFTTAAFVFVIFGVVELLGHSGAIAALAIGITLGNIDALKLPLLKDHTPLNPLKLSKRENAFFSELVFLIKTFFFVYVGISIQFSNVSLLIAGLLISIIIAIVRILSVRFTLPKSTPAIDAILTSVVFPKGLAAAVLASIPLQLGLAHGELIQNITFSVILFSIFFSSLFIFLVENTRIFKIFQSLFGSFAGTPQSIKNIKIDTQAVEPIQEQ